MTDDTHDPAANHLPPPRIKDPAAVSLGRRGGQAKSAAKTAAVRKNGRRGGRKGGKATARRMTPEQRTERARKANAARSAKRQENTSSPG